MAAVVIRMAERYSTYIHHDHILGYLKALKIVIAADENISPKELHALRLGMRFMGIPEEVRRQVEEFDPLEVRLLQVLPNFRLGGLEARYMVRDAVELASSDGVYSTAERAAVNRIASMLGVGKEMVRALESLVELERATRRLKKALLPQGLPAGAFLNGPFSQESL
ncbi:TerB family tellurite resistance protein [bacterium]|nr:TerB family tellurite resistance protein [bacterium]